VVSGFEDYVARVEQMLADPERLDPARLAQADQMLPKLRQHWEALIEVSRPLLAKGMDPVEFVDFIMMAYVGTEMPPEQAVALLGVALLRSYELAVRRHCGAGSAERLGSALVCVLPSHQSGLHVGLDKAGYPVRFRLGGNIETRLT